MMLLFYLSRRRAWQRSAGSRVSCVGRCPWAVDSSTRPPSETETFTPGGKLLTAGMLFVKNGDVYTWGKALNGRYVIREKRRRLHLGEGS